jgi:hypothetical protein
VQQPTLPTALKKSNPRREFFGTKNKFEWASKRKQIIDDKVAPIYWMT